MFNRFFLASLLAAILLAAAIPSAQAEVNPSAAKVQLVGQNAKHAGLPLFFEVVSAHKHMRFMWQTNDLEAHNKHLTYSSGKAQITHTTRDNVGNYHYIVKVKRSPAGRHMEFCYAYASDSYGCPPQQRYNYRIKKK